MVKSHVKERKRGLAEESAKTRRAREKLKKKFEALDKEITPEALQEKTIEIHKWIERHQSDRMVLRSKAIALFDENQNAAEVSKKVMEIAEQIKRDFMVFKGSEDSLQKSKKLLQSMLERKEIAAK